MTKKFNFKEIMLEDEFNNLHEDVEVLLEQLQLEGVSINKNKEYWQTLISEMKEPLDSSKDLNESLK